ncbi:hypothetical protein [Neisseria sp. Ec49-e6-T10]|uniref:hypothetical protein n=1 Tax=Neisseria sp. Ec49-e6-T10 TaxID=3140744 RepID=UPI003EB69531
MKHSFRIVISMMAIALISSGCTSTMIKMAHKIDERDQARKQKGTQSFAQKEHERFEALKAKGDPDGYYFLAIEFALSKRGQSTPENLSEIKRRYEEAVAKGSNDAKVALGNMLVTGDTVPFEFTNTALPLKDRDIERGLRLMSEAATKSCMYKQPLFRDAQCGNIRMFNPAIKIWVPYRDGIYDRDSAQVPWVKLVQKNEVLAQKWKQRRDQCEAEIQAYRKEHRCKNY